MRHFIVGLNAEAVPIVDQLIERIKDAYRPVPTNAIKIYANGSLPKASGVTIYAHQKEGYLHIVLKDEFDAKALPKIIDMIMKELTHSYAINCMVVDITDIEKECMEPM